MLCCFDASVADEDTYVAAKKKSKRPKKKGTFEEVEMRMGPHERMNGRIPGNPDDSLRSSATEGDETPDGSQDDNHDDQHEEQDDTVSQVDLLHHKLHQLEKERDDYRSRLSFYAASTLRDNNPNITDLSDPNRPDALGQRIIELYDNQWTDAYIYLTENGMDEKSAIGILVNMLRTVYRVCKTLSSQQMNSLGSQIGFFTGFQEVPPHLLTTVQMYKDERKKNYKKFLPTLEKKSRKYVKTMRGLGDHFFLEALETCWLLCIQDPPMALDFACFPGDVFDSKSFRPFTNPGSHVDYIVWPSLRLYENGPLLNKGFAQGRRGGLPTHHMVTRRLTADPRPEHGSVYRRRDNSAQLSRITESSQEYQTSFLSSHPSEYSRSQSSGRPSAGFMSSYDSQSQRSRSIRDQQRRENEFKEFLKNADFKATEETDTSVTHEHNDNKQIERFVMPGRKTQYDMNANELRVTNRESNDSLLKLPLLSPKKDVQDTTNERTFVDEETQTARSPSNHTDSSVNTHLQQNTEHSSQQLSFDQNHDIETKTVVCTDKELNKTTERTGDSSLDVILENDQETELSKNSEQEHRSKCESILSDTIEGSIRGEVRKSVDINDNINSKPFLDEYKQIESQSIVTERANMRTHDEAAVTGILKNHKPHSETVVNSPNGSTISSLKCRANRKANTRTIKRHTPTASAGSSNSSTSVRHDDSVKQNQTDILANEETRQIIKSPEFLTIKVNKINRIPKRNYPDDPNEFLRVHEDEFDRINSQHHNRNTHESKNHPTMDYTPRNVPSVESGARTLSTLLLSRNTLGPSTDNTPRPTARSSTPVPNHQKHISARHTAAFEYDSSRVSTDLHKHTPNKEPFKEIHGRSTGDGSRLSEGVRAIKDYTPRNKTWQRSPRLVKQYPALTPDFSNTIKLMPDSGSFILAPKPPPKIPGKVAARLRFATY